MAKQSNVSTIKIPHTQSPCFVLDPRLAIWGCGYTVPSLSTPHVPGFGMVLVAPGSVLTSFVLSENSKSTLSQDNLAFLAAYI